MEEVELLETFDQHQSFPSDHHLSNCNISSDNDTTDTSSSNVSEDEASIKTEPANPEIVESPLSSSSPKALNVHGMSAHFIWERFRGDFFSVIMMLIQF